MAVFILALLLAISYGARDVSGQQDKLLQNVRNIGTDVKTILRMLVEERKHKTVRGPLKNLALKRKAYQSTKGGWDPNLAVDGSTYYQPWGKAGSCTHTGTEPHPWWYVDLGHVYHIQSIKVQTRVECCGQHTHDIAAFLAGHDKKFSNACGYYVGPAHTGELVVFDCPGGTRGRYVKLQIMKGAKNVLDFCEVRVFGW